MRFRAASALKITTMATAGAAAVLAAGCSSGGGSGHSNSHSAATSMSPTRAVTLAAQQAQRVNSFAGTMSIKMSGRLSGNIDGTMQMRERPSLLADVHLSTVNVAGHSIPGGARELMNSQAVYIKMPALQRELGKPWLKMSFSRLKGASGMNLGQLIQQAESDSPLLQTRMLAAASHVAVVGTRTVGGVATTEYTGTYPIAAALAKLPASLRGQMRQHLQSMGLTSARFTVWIDAQHLARKLIVDEHGSAQQMTMNMQVTSVNQPVKISFPAHGQIATIPTSPLGG